MKKFCKVKMGGEKEEIQKCVRAENKKQAEKKLRDVDGKLVELK